MNNIRDDTKFYSVTEYVDTETGEILKEYQIKNGDYIVHNTTKKTEKNGKIILIKWQKECRENNQLKLF